MKPKPNVQYRQNLSGPNQKVLHRWDDDLKRSVDEIRSGAYISIDSDITLTQWYMGRNCIFDMSGGDIVATLPSVDATDLFGWICLIRHGQDNKLTILAADSDRIEYSSTPGRVWCDERKRLAANLTLVLVASTQWAILSGTGIWKTA